MNSDNKVISLPAKTKGDVVGRKAPRYPQLAAPEQLEVDLASIGDAVRNLHTALGSVRELREVVPRAKGLVAMAKSTSLTERMRRLGEPATTGEITAHIVNLIASDPRDDIAEPDLYIRNMEQDLGSLGPSRFAIEAGCRKIRRTLRFRPKIAEVYAAVQEAEKAFQSMAGYLQVLPERLARAEAELAESEARIRKYEEQQAAEKGRIREALAAGMDWADATRNVTLEMAGDFSREIRDDAARAPDESERQRILRLIGEDDDTLQRWKAERAAQKAAEEAENRRVLDEEFAKTKAKMVLKFEIIGCLERGDSVESYDDIDVLRARMEMRSRA